MSDLLDAVWNDTAIITIHYKLHINDLIYLIQLEPEEYFTSADNHTPRWARHNNTSDYLPIPVTAVEWTRLEERSATGTILRSLVTKYLDEGAAWICQIRIYCTASQPEDSVLSSDYSKK